MADNPDAFPCLRSEYDSFAKMEKWVSEDGMSLRDWFAGLALSRIADPTNKEVAEQAAWCYQMAEAMLEERERIEEADRAKSRNQP